MSDFFTSRFGDFWPHSWRARRYGSLVDAVVDRGMRFGGGARTLETLSHDAQPRRILVVGVAVPGRTADMDKVVADLRDCKHRVVVSIVSMQPMGKFENVDAAIRQAPEPLDTFDWLVVTDDDVALPPRFLDGFIALAEKADLRIAQPAHRFRSYASWPVTQRRWGSLARASGFVEIGPLTALHRSTFDQLVPFPATRWCWGVDVLWAAIARRNGWRIGIVDGTPLEHCRQIANSYGRDEAVAEGKAFLERFGITLGRRELFAPTEVVVKW